MIGSLFFLGYPIWLIIPCFLLAAGIAYFFYKKSSFNKKQKIVLSLSRGFVLFFLFLFLFSPLIKLIYYNKEKPLIAIGIDNSSSILLNKDSLFYKNSFFNKVDDLIAKLNNKFDIHTFSIGNQTTENYHKNFDKKKTNISDFFSTIKSTYEKRNLASVLLLTDGIYNSGTSPEIPAKEINVPIYSVALGDTSLQRDLLIEKIDYPENVLLDNDFRINIKCKFNNYKGRQTDLKIFHNGLEVYKKSVTITNNFQFENFPVDLKANSEGIQVYKISLSALPNELSLNNNSQTILVDVKKGKLQISLLANAPHPDLSAIKQSIEKNKNYACEITILNSNTNIDLKEKSLIILHALPSSINPQINLFNALKQSGLPLLYILGSQLNPDLFNKSQSVLYLNLRSLNFAESQPFEIPNFYLFELSEDTRKKIAEFPPLNCPFGSYKLNTQVNFLYNQSVNNINTGEPLIAFSNAATKIGFICGEGIWKWRLFDFRIHKNTEALDELILKSIQFLCTKDIKKQFKVSIPKTNFDENENINFYAELRNESMELINSPDVHLIVKNEAGKEYTFEIGKVDNYYSLNAGGFSEGNYTYKASVDLNNKTLIESGRFFVSRQNLEELNTVANHNLLYKLSENSGGKFYYPNNMDSLAVELLNNQQFKTISFEEKKYEDLINLKIIFGLILALLCFEWFFRKREGEI